MTNDELVEASISLLCKDRGSYSLNMMLRKNGFQFSDEQFNIVERKLLDAKVIEPDSMVPGRPNFRLSQEALSNDICEIGFKKYKEKKEMQSQRKYIHQEIIGSIVTGSTIQQSESGNNQSNNNLVTQNTTTPKRSMRNTIVAFSISIVSLIIGTWFCHYMGWL